MWSFFRKNRSPEDEALKRAERALDENLADLRPLAEIDRILTARHDWRAQEAAYRRLIKRFGTALQDDARSTVAALWYALGEIYRSRLKDDKAALAAFEVVIQVDPDSELGGRAKSIAGDLRALIDAGPRW